MRRPAWPDLPLVLGSALLAVGSALLLAQLLILWVHPGRPMKLSAGLAGVVAPADPVPLSWSTLLDGRLEAAVSHNVGSLEPYYATAVRLRNQVEYTLLGFSAEPAVLVGGGGQLLETGYATEYCARDVAAFERRAPAWAQDVKQVQDAVQRRGQTFLYVVTPSKAAQYPADLPPAMPCPSTQADRLGMVPAWTTLLAQDGVRALDTSSALRAAHGAYPFMLFPRAGTHWDAVGSTLATAAVEQALQAQRAAPAFASLHFTWRLAPEPTEDDVDLANLMNLFRLPGHFDVPIVAVSQPGPPAGCRPLRIAIVGGSFMEAIAARLSVAPCVGSVVEYFYWQVARFSWRNGARSRASIDPGRRDRELEDADIVILEQNESTLGTSRYVAALRDLLAADLRYPAPPRSSPAPG